MTRAFWLIFVIGSLAFAAIVIAPLARAEGPIQRAIEREELKGEERDLLAKIMGRLKSDKRFVGSAMHVVVAADKSVTLKGSVTSEAVKASAVELVENTVGVEDVVDELAIAKASKTHKAKHAAPKRVTTEPASEDSIVTP